MKNLIIRALSGIIYVALIVIALLLGPWYFTGLCCLFAVLAILEMSSLFNKPMIGTLTLLDALSAIAIAAFPLSMMIERGMMVMYCCLTFIPACLVIRCVTSLFDMRPSAFMSTMMSFGSVAYIAIPLCCLNMLYAYAGWQLVLAMFVMIWINDTGAYCFGTLLGKHKMSPRLSPKKSWEGFVGGLVCAAGVGLGAFYCCTEVSISCVMWIVLGVLVGIFATWGDLFESLMKRSIGVKDAGHLIPGHGGILDRIDSLLIVAPFTFLFYFFTLAL